MVYICIKIKIHVYTQQTLTFSIYIHMHVCSQRAIMSSMTLTVSLIPHRALRFCFNYFFL